MKLQLIRHATILITYGGKRLLVDPMFSGAGTLSPVAGSGDSRSNPLVPLPVPADQLLDVDGVLLTHSHRDHWDEAAVSALPKQLPVWVQSPDAERVRQAGFIDVRVAGEENRWDTMTLYRTAGRHGKGIMGRKMGAVSGFVLHAPGEPTLYTSGDTIWCGEVREALHRYSPDVTILFAGGARFLLGGAVTMDKRDIGRVCLERTDMKTVVVHMEAWNHCFLTRETLKRYLHRKGLMDRALVPDDGETLDF